MLYHVSELRLQTAVGMTEAGLARARELGVQVNIAIVDGAGHRLSFSRMDEAMLGSIDVALKKARTAALFRRPSAAMAAITQPGAPAYGLQWSNEGLVCFGGGLPITDEFGQAVIGAVGVSGGTVDQDVLVAEACLRFRAG